MVKVSSTALLFLGALAAQALAEASQVEEEELGVMQDDECSASDGAACALNALQARSSRVQAEAEESAGAEASYVKIGSGGCSTDRAQYPTAISKTSAVSASACQRLCDNSPRCGAYEYCYGSNCDGNCNQFSEATKTNGYPGVSCYVKQKVPPPPTGFHKVGAGGCSSWTDKYPAAMRTVSGVSKSFCRSLCEGNARCRSFEHCKDPSCSKKCKLFSFTASSANGYPGVKCWSRR